jgi:glutaminyl-peptide cyclotransferase
VVARLLGTVAGAALLGAAACGGDGGGGSAGGAVLPPGMTQVPGTTEAPPPAVPFSPETPVYAAREVASLPHDRNAFTEGLFVHDGVLYESTGLEGKSDVRRMELATGKVLGRVVLPEQYFGEGIAVVDGRLYQLTWKDQKGWVRDPTTLAPLDSFSYAGEGWSLTTDDSLLYMSDGTSRVRVVDPDGFRVVRTIDVTEAGRPVHYVNELEWVKGELWANIWLKDVVARIDPKTGHVVGWIDLAPLAAAARRENPSVDVTNGIAYDAATDRVLVTGKYWPRIVAIEVVRQ